MKFDMQPRLENEACILVPLQESDFEVLYAVASDPLVWEQHPKKDRWKREVFRTFFEGALNSGAAYKILIKATGEVAGSTRFYQYDEADNSLFIGYTFYGRKYWGSGLNHAVKRMMLDYAFQYVDKVYFHIGAHNLRSQISITRLGAEKVAEEQVSYYGEPPTLNYVYRICKSA